MKQQTLRLMSVSSDSGSLESLFPIKPYFANRDVVTSRLWLATDSYNLGGNMNKLHTYYRVTGIPI
jgi:hypothetical protein